MGVLRLILPEYSFNFLGKDTSDRIGRGIALPPVFLCNAKGDYPLKSILVTIHPL